MLSSLARCLEPLPDGEGDLFLTQIQALFQSDFIAKQKVPDQEEGEPLNISSRPADSNDPTSFHVDSEERLQEGGRHLNKDTGRVSLTGHTADTTSVTSSSTVLHLGSVLSAEHDYLL